MDFAKIDITFIEKTRFRRAVHKSGILIFLYYLLILLHTTS